MLNNNTLLHQLLGSALDLSIEAFQVGIVHSVPACLLFQDENGPEATAK